MKKITIGTLVLIATSLHLSAQQWTTFGTHIYNSNTGNIGIGTTTPIDKLHVQNGNLQITSNNYANYLMGTIKFSTSTWNYAWSGIGGSTNGLGWDQMDLLFYTAYGSPSEKMRLMANTGYLGIGTSAPTAKLDVRGTVSIGVSKVLNINPDYAGIGEIPSGVLLGTNGSDALSFAASTNTGSAGAKVTFNYHSGATWFSAIEFANVATGYSNLSLMKTGGNVGIGTTTPAAKLDVNGTTYSRKLYVGTPDANTLANMGSNNLLAVNGTAVFVKAKVAVYGSSWPDYVFHKDYQLPTLSEIENFIKQNGHLPEMPTAAEVEKDGIDLGRNQALLLKKVEELTLYIISHDKKAEAMRLLIDKLSQKIETLTEKSVQ